MKKWAAVAGVAVLACGLAATRSWAQPTGEAGKAANPPQPKTEKQQIAEILQKSQQAALDVMAMPPEQQAQWMQKMQADALRVTLKRSGFNDLELQETLQNFLIERAQSRRPLRVTTTLLYLANEPKGMKLSEAQFEALLNRYESEAAAQKAREEKELDNLDEKIQWKTRPRLRAFLLHYGVVGDTARLASTEFMSPGLSTELEIVQFWNANQKLPPGTELPPAQ